MPSLWELTRLLLFLSWVLTHTTTMTVSAATDPDDVKRYEQIHLNYFRKVMVDYRCDYIENSIKNYSHRLIQFTHVAKAGGTTVSRTLREKHSARFDHSRHAHESFGFADHVTSQTRLFITVFRNPIDRAISMYNYMRGILKSDPETEKGVAVWEYTRGSGENVSVSLDQWIVSPIVKRHLEFSLTSLFDEGEKEANPDHVTSEESMKTSIHSFNWPFGKEKIIDTFPVSQKEFLEYIQKESLPEQYSCDVYVKIALLLLKRFSAVGQLEMLHLFYFVLNARADMGIPLSVQEQMTHIHKNPSPIFATNTEVAKARELAAPYMFCPTVLWKIAGILSAHDASSCTMVKRSFANNGVRIG